MGPQNQKISTFMRRIQELADDLGKNAEDIRNAFVKAMPAHVIPSIAALDNLEQMAACIKCLLTHQQVLLPTYRLSWLTKILDIMLKVG